MQPLYGLSIFASAISLALMIPRWNKLRGTTLLAPAVWLAICCLLAFCLSFTCLATDGEPSNLRLLLFLVANSSFCPQMGLFGAKRPQDRGWQVIVVTLWIVLSIPVLQSLAFSSDSFFEIHGIWKIFLWTLIGYGFLNHLLTKFAAAAFFMCIGQVSIFAPFLLPVEPSPQTCLAIFQISLLLGVVSTRLAAAKKHPGATHPLDALWLDFRNMFGTVWSLRVMERVNHLARQENWPVQLTWHGFTSVTPFHDEGLRKDIEKCLRTLLRRFVDSDWIDVRLSSPGKQESGA